MNRIIFLIASVFFSYSALAQTPVANFSIPATGCMQQQVNIQNMSSGADAYWWDFCLNDFLNFQTSKDVSNISGFQDGYGYKLVESNRQWFGFATSRANNKIFRLEFGSDPTKAPNVVDLGNPGGLLHLPEGLEIIQANGNWYGFVGSLDFSSPTSGIIRLNFGSSLQNAPTAQNLGNFGFSTRFRELKCVAQNSDLILILANYNSNSIVRINYHNSFDNIIGVSDIIDSGSISGISLLLGFDVVKKNSTWIMLLASLSNSSIVQLNFGADILSTPSVDGNYSFPGVNRPYEVKITLEGDNYFVVVSNETTGIDIINFNDLNPSNTPAEVGQSAINLLGFVSFRWMGASIVQGINSNNNIVKTIFYKSSCDASFDFAQTIEPSGLTFSISGNKKIELTAFNSTSGIQVTNTQQINISSSTSPDINFASQNYCAGNNVNFTSSNSSGNITNYSWDFGDGGNSSDPNPSYIFSNAGTYKVNLTVTASNSCQNFFKDTLQIFNAPQANFSLPASSPICSNQNYSFTNTSTFDNGSNPTWQWSVNSAAVATSQDLNYIIPDTQAQNVTLTASIPGCSSQSSQSISTVQDGPLVSFSSPATGCVNSPAAFINSSTGTITSYHWDFGDGNSSSQPNASNSYASNGIFAVTLTASNTAGCQNFLTKNFPVYSNPQPDFAIEAPPYSCANYPAQFDNNTPALVDSNITSWAWSFGDAANGTSSQKNPSYTYTSASNFTVTLQATSNFGCTSSIQKNIVISPSPISGFTNTPACVNQNTIFTDASTGSVTSYQWLIQGTTFAGANPPPYVFKSNGTYPVSLTTTAVNGCKNQIVKNINVPVPPVMDFTYQPPCAGKPTTFQELNSGGADPSVSWNWNFGAGSGVGSPIDYSFASPGIYLVTLNATRNSGCVYSTSKNVNIYNAPIAKFTPSAQSGKPPLTVIFNNESTADAYSWQFGDGDTTSTATSPTYTYNEFGEYKVMLTASNIHGCADTTSTKIYAVVPKVDLAMMDFLMTDIPNSNSSQPVVTISNLGNIPMANPEVQIDLGGNAVLKEKISATILPGKSIQQTLSLQIVPQATGYICAEVESSGDIDTFNNRQCFSMDNNDVLFYPYPNPASGQINFDWISTESERVTVIMYKSTGQITFKQDFVVAQAGINQLAIDISSLSSGLYLIQFSGVNVKKTFSVSVIN